MGRLVVIEGLDGAGKNTLARRLVDALAARGARATAVAFPRYDADARRFTSKPGVGEAELSVDVGGNCSGSSATAAFKQLGESVSSRINTRWSRAAFISSPGYGACGSTPIDSSWATMESSSNVEFNTRA